MILILRVSAFLFALRFVHNKIYLDNTNDGLSIDYYDCALAQSLLYCRRPREPTDLSRDNDIESCELNGGKLHRFSQLIQTTNITTSMILHEWKSSLERVEQYSRYVRNASEPDGYLCQCLDLSSFGKNCEYRLPVGETLEQSLNWQLIMRNNNPMEVQMHGNVVCYETLECDSGVLCLDWREICDGIQNCMSGLDEENCDLLEMNRCADDEYRCMNGMCIPDQFFLDGDLDCLEWSDEMPFRKSDTCPGESVSTVCDDHLCPPNEWSCGDGQCITDRLVLWKLAYSPSCRSGRDRYFICETRRSGAQWTMPNGRCYDSYESERYNGSVMANSSEEDPCEYLLKCALSQGKHTGCSCDLASGCIEQFKSSCSLSSIQYPRGAIVAPFIFFLFNRTRNAYLSLPDSVLINATVRCRNSSITETKTIPLETNLNARRLIEDHFCQPFRKVRWSEVSRLHEECHHTNESTDRCNEWNPCMSVTRVKDGLRNCLNGTDEGDQTAMEVEKSCARVRRHRFCCSIEQPTCLSVTKLGDLGTDCHNGFDQSWLGADRELSLINCNTQKKDECSLLRQYIAQSWIMVNDSKIRSEHRISFRSYCDTFWTLDSREDENLGECQRSWVCPDDQWRCQSGQCVEPPWNSDGEWDCGDASDEHLWLNYITPLALERASLHNFTDRDYFVPSACNQSHPFLCMSATATQLGFSCFDLSQIGDGHVDCAGAIDERNTLKHCSQSSMLGTNFRCSSTNTCIPYDLHCSNDHQCPNRSDDEFWCSRQDTPEGCSDSGDFTCFDGQCIKYGRCDRNFDCPFAEDEYMCNYRDVAREVSSPYREQKRLLQTTKKHTVRLPFYPSNANITQLMSQRTSIPPPAVIFSNNSSMSPYWCNRGLGVLLRNDSVVCFCPPQYYGDKCEYHADRLSVVLRLNLPQSTYTSGSNSFNPLKLLVLFLLNNQTLNINQFYLHTSSDTITQKLITHFPYPHSSLFRQQRQERFFNRSDILSLTTVFDSH